MAQDHFVRNLGINLPGQAKRKPRPKNEEVVPLNAQVTEAPVHMTLAQKLVSYLIHKALLLCTASLLNKRPARITIIFEINKISTSFLEGLG